MAIIKLTAREPDRAFDGQQFADEIQFWDRERYPPRKVSGFYTRDDLERLRRQRQFALALDGITIDTGIAGRDDQNEAIRRVSANVLADVTEVGGDGLLQ